MCVMRRYKHAKQRDIDNARDRGMTVHKSKKQPLSISQTPVNSEAFLQQKESDVPVEDQFFYKFFKERARRNVGKGKKSKQEEEDEEAEMDKLAEDMADEMMNQKVGSEDDDVLDDFEQDENGRFLEEGEDENMEDELDFGGDDDVDDDDDEGMILDEGDDGSKKKTEKHKKKMKSLYASAEEFENMLAATAEEREKKEKNRKSVKRGKNKQGKGPHGKKRK